MDPAIDITLAVSALIGALSLAVPRVVDAWQRHAHADSVTAETVRSMFAEMRRKMGEMSLEIGMLRERVANLEAERDQLADAHNAVVEQLVSAEGRIALLTSLLTASDDKRAELLREFTSAGGSDRHAAHTPPLGVDIVIAAQKRRERSQ